MARSLFKRTRKLKDKVVDVTSDILSAPARIRANNAIKRSSEEARILRTVREMKNVPDRGNETDPLFRMRVVANRLRNESKKKTKKKRRRRLFKRK